VHYTNVILYEHFTLVVLSKKKKIPLEGCRHVWEVTFEMDIKWIG
jgi:hypothetical protein